MGLALAGMPRIKHLPCGFRNPDNFERRITLHSAAHLARELPAGEASPAQAPRVVLGGQLWVLTQSVSASSMNAAWRTRLVGRNGELFLSRKVSPRLSP